MKVANAIKGGCTAFPLTRKSARDTAPVLKPARNNRKFGRGVFKRGPFKGMPLYSLTLEERATCPANCPEWATCYGNNMPFAHRFEAGMELELALIQECQALSVKHPHGYVIRLHVLGDFYSEAYVKTWRSILECNWTLRVFGYTHRKGPIAHAIDLLSQTYPKRFVIFQSDGKLGGIRPVAICEGQPNAESLPLCPQQAGKVASCLECGLCTNPNIRGVRWAMH